jgi:hypothetical protein
MPEEFRGLAEAVDQMERELEAAGAPGPDGKVAVPQRVWQALVADWRRLAAAAGGCQEDQAALESESAVVHLATHTDPRAPGFATWGMIVEAPDGSVFGQRSGYLVNQSDVHAMYQALQAALDMCRGAFDRLKVLTPSQTVSGQMAGTCQVGFGVEAALRQAQDGCRRFARVRCQRVEETHLGAKYLAQSLLDELAPPRPLPDKPARRSWLGLVSRRAAGRSLDAGQGRG